MSGINSVMLSGVAATEPEMRYTQAGKAVTGFRIAVATGRQSQAGKDLTDYFTITVWGADAERIAEQVNKGTAMVVQGRLTNESYQGQDGKKRYVTKVTAYQIDIFGPQGRRQESSRAATPEDTEPSEARDIDPDEIPF